MTTHLVTTKRYMCTVRFYKFIASRRRNQKVTITRFGVKRVIGEKQLTLLTFRPVQRPPLCGYFEKGRRARLTVIF